ncbi:hypothetical protein TrRE_jg7348, partial [Triparma retinervis]
MGNKASSLESQLQVKAGRKAIADATGLTDKQIVYLERLYIKGAQMASGSNLYGQYAYDDTK